MILLHPASKTSLDYVLVDSPQTIAVSGENGIGKAYVACYIAYSLLDTDMSGLDAHPYVLRLDAKNKAGIEDVRDIQRQIATKVPSSRSVNRVVLITDIDMLGHEAQNALLKTLEEPPEGTVVILTYSSPDSVLATIRSRAQNIELKPIPKQQIQRELDCVFEQADIDRAFAMSYGKPGELLSILNDTDSSTVKAIQQAKKILSMDRYRRLCQVDAWSKKDSAEIRSLLVGMATVLRVSQRQLVSRPRSQQTANLSRLEALDIAITDISDNVNKKLILSDLFSTI